MINWASSFIVQAKGRKHLSTIRLSNKEGLFCIRNCTVDKPFIRMYKMFVLWPCAFEVRQNHVINLMHMHRKRVHNEHLNTKLIKQEQIPHGACLLYIFNPAWHFTQGKTVPFISWMLAALFHRVWWLVREIHVTQPITVSNKNFYVQRTATFLYVKPPVRFVHLW